MTRTPATRRTGAAPASGGRRLRGLTRATAASGTVFAVLLVIALALVRQAPGLGVPDDAYTAFYADGGHSDVLVTVGLHIVPFAGIAFLWYAVALRTLVQAAPGQPPPLALWLQLAAAVVVVCTMFVASALVGAVALLRVFSADPLPPPDVARALASAGYGVAFVYGVRAAGMFMITTTSLLRHARLLPRWLGWVGYVLAVGLLASTTFHPAILLVFPVWVVVTCGAVLLSGGRAGPVAEPE
jgi:hypothetical protein